MKTKEKHNHVDHILNYCRWIVFGNNVVKYNVGDDSHTGWYVNDYGFWKYKNYYTFEIKQGIKNGCTVLGHTNENYDFVTLRKFLPKVYQ